MSAAENANKDIFSDLEAPFFKVDSICCLAIEPPLFVF